MYIYICLVPCALIFSTMITKFKGKALHTNAIIDLLLVVITRLKLFAMEEHVTGGLELLHVL